MRTLEETVIDWAYHISPLNMAWSGNPIRTNETYQLEQDVLYYLKEYLKEKEKQDE